MAGILDRGRKPSWGPDPNRFRRTSLRGGNMTQVSHGPDAAWHHNRRGPIGLRIFTYLLGGLAAGLAGSGAGLAQWEKAGADSQWLPFQPKVGNPTSSWLPFGPQDIIPPHPDRGW